MGKDLEIWISILQISLLALLLIIIFYGLLKIINWAKGAPKGAFILLGIFPLLSLFPIPPSEFKNLDKTKYQQRKRKEDSGDPPELDDQDENKINNE